VACEATARLYDVDEDSVIFTKLQQTERYDQGTIKFSARQDHLIDLDKLHESIWATRLSGGTRSGLVSLDITAIGQVARSGNEFVLKVAGSDAEFVLRSNPDDKQGDVFGQLRAAVGQSVKLTGRIDNYAGRWPDVMSKPPAKPRRILVTEFEAVE
jgi:hypothetical protein